MLRSNRKANLMTTFNATETDPADAIFDPDFDPEGTGSDDPADWAADYYAAHGAGWDGPTDD